MGVEMTPVIITQLRAALWPLPASAPDGSGSGGQCCGRARIPAAAWVSAQSYSLTERTLMLPLTEGSLRLRADDEDSLTSEDSFFSATEVISWGTELGWARPSGPALGWWK